MESSSLAFREELMASSRLHPPPPPSSSPVIGALEEIMRMYKSLLPRPTMEEVEAAKVTMEMAKEKEDLKLSLIDDAPKPSELSEELFMVLQEVRRLFIVLQGHQQRKEAQLLIDIDAMFRAFDDLLRRVSIIVSGSGDEGANKDENIMQKASMLVTSSDVELLGASKSISLSENSHEGAKGGKLSLIKVATLIESSSKNGTEVLDLKSKLMDQIEWLPSSLDKLQAITDLIISENQIVTLPSTIGRLRALTRLDLHSNQLTDLPDSIGGLTSLSDLNLSSNKLNSLPVTIGEINTLITLNLSSNQLSELPETLGKLNKLRSLNLETNELQELPYTIGSCTSLNELRLDFNQLKALPEAIGKLECLEVLTLHYNRVKCLPATMSSLANLKELDVSFNELETIPETLCFATSLEKLNVGRNFADLRALPRSIGNLEMLVELDISDTQIRVLPESFRFLGKLRVLHADETPLEVPPRTVIKLGAQAVVQYMANLVAEREKRSEQPEEKMCGYLCFCPRSQSRRKDLTTGVVSTKA